MDALVLVIVLVVVVVVAVFVLPPLLGGLSLFGGAAQAGSALLALPGQIASGASNLFGGITKGTTDIGGKLVGGVSEGVAGITKATSGIVNQVSAPVAGIASAIGSVGGGLTGFAAGIGASIGQAVPPIIAKPPTQTLAKATKITAPTDYKSRFVYDSKGNVIRVLGGL